MQSHDCDLRERWLFPDHLSAFQTILIQTVQRWFSWLPPYECVIADHYQVFLPSVLAGTLLLSITPRSAMLADSSTDGTMRYSDLFVNELKTFLHNVQAEPLLSVLDNGTKLLFDVRVFHPYANCYMSRSLPSLNTSLQKWKEAKIQHCILQLEMGSTPLIFFTVGGMRNEAKVFLKRLCEKVPDKRRDSPIWIKRILRIRICTCGHCLSPWF